MPRSPERRRYRSRSTERSRRDDRKRYNNITKYKISTHYISIDIALLMTEEIDRDINIKNQKSTVKGDIILLKAQITRMISISHRQNRQVIPTSIILSTMSIQNQNSYGTKKNKGIKENQVFQKMRLEDVKEIARKRRMRNLLN